ncbi:hypothetical protein VN97_g3672 [Penicillium thymicola]|uniref:Uncharacterized protein n=1 Tax=Penicillium thymicola TaxID=293382 RepID=A0AAI9TMJ0_PENTH|nr:hypothetical protein VN97_g3672 [Penicillium thymicola]
MLFEVPQINRLGSYDLEPNKREWKNGEERESKLSILRSYPIGGSADPPNITTSGPPYQRTLLGLSVGIIQ